MQKLNSLTIFVNNKCELNCKYCFVDKESSTNLTYSKNIEKVLISLLDKLDEGDTFTVLLMGGEPLLNFIFIEKVITLLNKVILLYSKINIYITDIVTNGIIYNELYYKFLFNNNIKLQFSVDDFLYSVYDKNRIHKENNIFPLYKIIKKNIGLYKKIYNEPPHISIVVTSDNVHFLSNLVIYYVEEIGVSNIVINTGVGNIGYNKNTKIIFKREYTKLLKYYVNTCIENNILIEPIEAIMKYILFHGKNINDISGCTLWKEVYLSYNEYFYTCLLHAGIGNKENKSMIVGNLKDGIDFEKINIGYNNMNKIFKFNSLDSFESKLGLKKLICLDYGIDEKHGKYNKEVYILSKKIVLLFLKHLSKKQLLILKSKKDIVT